MKLFYTVVSKEGAEQSKPSLSLGGFCSASEVQNGALEALFSDISPYTLQKDQQTIEYVGLILKNTFDRVVTGLSFWFNQRETDLCQFSLALVELNDNGEMEHIPSVTTRPMYAEFLTPKVDDKIVVEGELRPGQMLGLWICRTLDNTSQNVKQMSDCNYLFEQWKQQEDIEKVETVELKIEFGYGE